MRRKVILYFSIIIFLCSILAITPFLYNEVIKPFEYNYAFFDYSKDSAVGKTYNNKYKEIVKNFYNEFVDYGYYEKLYKTDFLSRYSGDCMFRFFTLDDYVDISFSFKVSLENDYELINSKLLNSIKFKSFCMYDESNEQNYFKDSFELDNYVFYEIYNNVFSVKEESYLNCHNQEMFLYSYNNKEREIIFSILIFDLSLDYLTDKLLESYIKKNIIKCF